MDCCYTLFHFVNRTAWLFCISSFHRTIVRKNFTNGRTAIWTFAGLALLLALIGIYGIVF